MLDPRNEPALDHQDHLEEARMIEGPHVDELQRNVAEIDQLIAEMKAQ